jgi:glutamyl-tRNA synthetase
MTVRTRFAPSPTGYLHIGGARTALFNRLFAKHNKGNFVLRIEDTDVARSTPESINAILDGMKWLNLDWDEGPFFQSKRFAIYREHTQRLLGKGLAYRCWCTPDELAERRKKALAEGRPPGYDRRCRDRPDTPEGPFAVRFKVPPGVTTFDDLVKGSITFDHTEIEDFVILRSDGTPTYNLCVVVDDSTMEISHVIRGDDHIANTPKQILLARTLGYPVPAFAHLPMILGSDRTRLSKRHGATSVMAYRDMGYLSHALVNYLARPGWSYGDQEIFTPDELVEKFSLEAVGKSSGIFNPEKLLWLNHHYIKESAPEGLIEPLLPILESMGIKAEGDPRLPAIIKTLQERARTLEEMAKAGLFYFKVEIEYDKKAAEKFLTSDKVEVLETLVEKLSGLEPFTEQNVEEAFNAILDEKGLKLGPVAQPVRVALTGGTVSPGIFETVSALGNAKTVERLKKAISYIKTAATVT